MKTLSITLSIFTVLLIHTLPLFGAPAVTSVSPVFGVKLGGTSVTLTGSGFTGATAVTFGPTPATSFIVDNDNQISATAPEGVIGSINVNVTTGSGTSPSARANLYTYIGDWFAYVALFDSTISSGIAVPVDTETDSEASPISMSSLYPFSVAITPDNRSGYFPNNNDSNIDLVDLATNTISTTITVAGSFLKQPAITPDGTFIYVPAFASNSIYPITIPGNIQGTPIPTGVSPTSSAITPDGKTLYVANYGSDTVTVIDISTNSPVVVATVPVGVQPLAVDITPNGKSAYVVNAFSSTVSIIDIATNTTPPPSPLATSPSPIEIAVSPNGDFAYVVNGVSNAIDIIDLSTNTVSIAAFTVGSMGNGNVIITPDGKKAYVSSFDQLVYPVDLTTNPPTVLTGITFPAGYSPKDIAVTPDPSPVAYFTGSIASSGTPSIFDASASLSPVGVIAQYTWNFGDGSAPVTTTMPTVTHSYGSSGSFNVTLTVTNTAGTSTTQAFTGHTMNRNGGPLASLSQNFSIIPQDPSFFRGKVVKERFLTQTDIIHALRWRPSRDLNVVGYLLYRNGSLIAEIPAAGPYKYYDHNRREHQQDIYTLVAFNAQGGVSNPVTTIVPNSLSSSSE